MADAKVALEIGYFDDAALLSWVRKTDTLSEHYENPLVGELLSLNSKIPAVRAKATALFDLFFESAFPDHDGQALDSQRTAWRMLGCRIRKCLDGSSSLTELCIIANRIDTIFAMPDWVSDMYDFCDWIAPEEKIDAASDMFLREQLHRMEVYKP